LTDVLLLDSDDVVVVLGPLLSRVGRERVLRDDNVAGGVIFSLFVFLVLIFGFAFLFVFFSVSFTEFGVMLRDEDAIFLRTAPLDLYFLFGRGLEHIAHVLRLGSLRKVHHAHTTSVIP